MTPYRKSPLLLALLSVLAALGKDELMATLTVRGIPEATKLALKARAARHDQSMEAEVRDILQAAVTEEQDFITGWLTNTAELRGDFELPPRSDGHREVSFD